MQKLNLQGKIEQIHLHEGIYYVDFVLPAIDDYSKPIPILLSTPRKIGAPGDELDVEVVISSYYRVFDKKDGTKGRDYKTRFEVI